MGEYFRMLVEIAPLAVAFVTIPLAVAVLGGTWFERRWLGVGVWAGWAAAVLLLTSILLVSAEIYAPEQAPVGLAGQLFFAAGTAAVLLTPPVLALHKLEPRLAAAPRMAVAFLIGLFLTVATAPITGFLVGCMLTGECL